MWDSLIIKPFINTLLLIYNLTGENFGIAIIVFTILVKLITHPLIARQIKSSAALQDLQKDEEYLEMQKKYKNDKERLAQAQMDLYKKKGIKPFASCLPTLLQFPIIIGLYQSIIQTMGTAPLQVFNLVSKIGMGMANFFSFIPGVKNPFTLIPLNNNFLWMDLSQPDRVYIPGISFGIPVLAIFVVITSIIQNKLINPSGGDPQANQATGMMNIYMPLLMGWFAYSLSSGLALYFAISNVLSLLQYAALGRVKIKDLFKKKAVPTKKPSA
ncbi:MAG: YidC/Oxa1 family membrane protein insertase [Pelolinea sp.]|jgi:YidC/Oxa1 family membrane protein insertase|nr:YidC/Oxa1 family membrane protein insertase [Pelolinea sp.]